ncbi:MAG: lamin tail domain-containing protein, partial [Planctomycetes bacterium]|nr:lamin tail domain-containing protein [Planctomycetota bacterium]
MAGPESLERRLVLDSTVVFNEIMYNPVGPDDDLEWIELHNQLAVDMDISAWTLEGGVDFEFPANTILPGRGYLVVAANPESLEAATGLDNVFGPFSGRLNNGGEELRLFNIDGRRLNVLDYSDDGDWPVEPDGGGASLAKADPLTNSIDAENWTFSADVGGTPGAANVVSVENIQLNEIAGADDGSFFIEIANDGPSTLNVGGYVLSATGLSGGDYVLPSPTNVSSGGLISIDSNTLQFSPVDGERLFLYTSIAKDELIDAHVVTNSLRGRSDEHDGQWLWPDVPTPSAPNVFAFHDEIVINEIMYHAPPQLRVGEAPFDGVGEQP